MKRSARRAPMPLGLGRIIEPVYRAAVARRNRAFDAGLRVEDVGAPVVSVGNISVGGTGKTPMVAAVVRMLQEMGRTPAIAMRGYGARPGSPSDEAAEHERALPGVPVVARPDRAAGVRELLRERPEIDAIVLDDGFQHRFVARALDIALVDATRDPFDDRCLPAGWLREPVESLARAGAVVITHAEAATPDAVARLFERLAAVCAKPPVAIARHSWSCLRMDAGERPIAWLRGRRAFAVCAVGNPAPFVDAIGRAGAEVAGSRALRDHARYTPALARRLWEAAGEAGAEVVLTTEKDWVKLGPALAAAGLRRGGPTGIACARPALVMEFVSGEERLRALVGAAAGAGAVVS